GVRKRTTDRYEPDYEIGLSAAQVAKHRADGWLNIAVDPPSKTTGEIIHENVFTYFNRNFCNWQFYFALSERSGIYISSGYYF
ncbi:MAG: hypothetical protein V8S14_03335, partial [Lachnospiraceae bacterium]